MSYLGDKFRERARDQREAVKEVRESPGNKAMFSELSRIMGMASTEEMSNAIANLLQTIPTEAQELRTISTVVGTITANFYEGMADFSDVFLALLSSKGLQDNRQKRLELMSQLNKAAAKGDWDEFDRISESLYQQSAGTTSEGDSTESPAE